MTDVRRPSIGHRPPQGIIGLGIRDDAEHPGELSGGPLPTSRRATCLQFTDRGRRGSIGSQVFHPERRVNPCCRCAAQQQRMLSRFDPEAVTTQRDLVQLCRV